MEEYSGDIVKGKKPTKLLRNNANTLCFFKSSTVVVIITTHKDGKQKSMDEPKQNGVWILEERYQVRHFARLWA
jgi:hypothetical protein